MSQPHRLCVITARRKYGSKKTMKTTIEQPSNRPGRLATGWHVLFNLACLLLLGGSTLSLRAGSVRGITVQSSYCSGATVRVEGRGWVAGEEVTIDFQPS